MRASFQNLHLLTDYSRKPWLPVAETLRLMESNLGSITNWTAPQTEVHLPDCEQVSPAVASVSDAAVAQSAIGCPVSGACDAAGAHHAIDRSHYEACVFTCGGGVHAASVPLSVCRGGWWVSKRSCRRSGSR